jgi:hypothetical protein
MNEWLFAAAFVVAGACVGLVYFALVRRTAAQLVSGEVHVGGAIGAVAIRVLLFAPGAVVSGVLSVVALGGYLVGFIAARQCVIQIVRRGGAK